MTERFDIAPASARLLESHGLTGLEPFFRWGRGDRLDKKSLEPWRQRWRLTLPDGDGQEHVFYLKRFDRPPLVRQFQRWCGGAYQSCAAVEWANARQLGEAGIPAPQPAAFGESMLGPIELRSFILLHKVQGESLEKICGLLKAAGLRNLTGWRQRRRYIDRLADLIGAFHRRGFVHRDLYLSHIYVHPALIEIEGQTSPHEPVFSIIDLQRVFKPRWRCRRWVIKDLAALHVSTPADVVSTNERLRFLCRYVRVCDRFGSVRQLAGLIERKTERMRRSIVEVKNIGNVKTYSPASRGLNGC